MQNRPLNSEENHHDGDVMCLPCFANRRYKNTLAHFGFAFSTALAIACFIDAAALFVIAQFESNEEIGKKITEGSLAVAGAGLGLAAIATFSFFSGTKGNQPVQSEEDSPLIPAPGK